MNLQLCENTTLKHFLKQMNNVQIGQNVYIYTFFSPDEYWKITTKMYTRKTTVLKSKWMTNKNLKFNIKYKWIIKRTDLLLSMSPESLTDDQWYLVLKRVCVCVWCSCVTGEWLKDCGLFAYWKPLIPFF